MTTAAVDRQIPTSVRLSVRLRRHAVPAILTALAVVLVVIGLIAWNQSQFAIHTVDSQLAAQGITMTPVSGLTPQQRTDPCLIQWAGQPLVNGAQAECYANDQIALDLLAVDNGKSYAAVSYPLRLAEVALGKLAATDPKSKEIPKEQAQIAQLEAPASTLFQGEALRGMLLTTYAFYHMGQLGEQIAVVLFALAGLALVSALLIAAWIGRRDRRRVNLT